MSDPTQQPGPYQPGPYQQSPADPGHTYPTAGGSQPSPSAPQVYSQPYGAPPEHPQGTAILVLGIVGIFVTICAPIAWYLGSKAQKEIAASGVHYANEQNITIGKILGMVLTILAIVGVVVGVVAMVVLFGLAAAGGAR